MKFAELWRFVIAALFLTSLTGLGAAEEGTLKDRLIGVWVLVSWEAINPDGSRAVPIEGAAPEGQLIFLANGRFSYQVITLIPKFAINDRLKATMQENNAVARGSLSQFGTYTVNEADHSFTLHMERSTFANQVGTDNKRVVTLLTTNEMSYTNFARAAGGQNILTWRRAR